MRPALRTRGNTCGLGATLLLALGCAGAADEAGTTGIETLTDSLGAELSPVSRAMVLANRAAEDDLNLIVRVQTRPGMLFEVYEPAPGELIYSGGGSREVSVPAPHATEAELHAAAIEAALAGAASSNTGSAAQNDLAERLSRSLVEMLARVAPRSLELPEVEAAVERERALLEAYGIEPRGPSLAEARQLVRDILGRAEVAGSAERGAAEQIEPPRHTLHTSFSGGYCDEEYFTEVWPGYPLDVPGYKWDIFDQTRTLCDVEDGTHDASKQDAQLGHTNACSARGTIKLSVKWRDDENSWTLQQNYWRWQQHSAPTCIAIWSDCPYFRSKVSDATGDRYHWRHYVHEG